MIKFIRRNTLAAFFVLALPAVCKADDMIVVKGGQKATIVISKKASSVEKYAAEELQRALQLMTGVSLPMASSASDSGGTWIVIGTPQSSREIQGWAGKLNLNGTNEEQIAVWRQANRLYLAGQTPRAALYATYTFLQDVLGARWFWPGPSGEFLPKHASISIGELNLSGAPGIKIRSLAITGTRNGDPDTDTWMARNRLNVVSVPANAHEDTERTKQRRQKGFLTRIAGHNVVLPDSLLQAHPEYIAELGGKRVFHPGAALQLCWSHTGTQAAVAAMIAGWWDRNSLVDIIHFYPADNQRYCQCGPCKEMGDVSTRWQKFSTAVIAKVEQSHPGKRYWTYAYQGYKSVPGTMPAPFEFVGYTLYDASYRHLLSGSNPFNALPLSEMEGWQKKGVNLGIRGYEYIIFKEPMFVPLVSWVTDQITWMDKQNLTGYLSELPPYGAPEDALPEKTYWNGSRMALYAAARKLWNTRLDADSIVKDWCSAVYGPAAPAMNAYYWEMDSAWRRASGKISLYKNPPASEVDRFLSPKTFDRAYTYFMEARTQIEGLPDAQKQKRIEEQIELESNMLASWQTVYRYKTGNARRYKADVLKVRQLTDSIWSHLPQLPVSEDKASKAAEQPTTVSLAWTEKALVLRLVCSVKNPELLTAKSLKQKKQVLAKEGIDIFIRPSSGKAACMHFAVSAEGSTHDGLTKGGQYVDTAWSSGWTAAVSVEKDAWVAAVLIPFASLGIRPRDSVQFHLAVKRRGEAGARSGWPDASDFKPENLGLVTLVCELVDRVDKRIILFDGGPKGGNLSVEFQQRGWQVETGISSETGLQQKLREDAGVLLLRYNEKNRNLSDDFLAGEIRNYLQKGRIVILAATGEIPVDQWFPVPKVNWTGKNQAPVRRSAFVRSGNWLMQPHHLARVVEMGLTPQTAYEPQTAGWEVLATIPLKQGKAQPFLLTHKVGDGLLVLTTSFMGYGGGYEMFGNRNTEQVVKLVENLQEARQHSFR